MKASYEDIRSRINVEPLWFDENGTPHYAPFHPDLLPDIYADEAAWAVIECQNCGHAFDVGVSRCKHDLRFIISGKDAPSLADDIRRGGIGYGDPPNIGCCPSGPTMSSNEIRVVEYWTRANEAREWVLDETLAIPLADFEESEGC